MADESDAFELATLSTQDGPQLRAMYQALVEEIPAILYINGPDEDSPTLYVSPQTEAILGLPQSGWFDNTWSRCVHPDDLDHVNETYTAILRTQDYGEDEYRFVRPDGRLIWLHDTVRVIRDESGAPALVQGVMFDVTERKRSEELLAQQAEQLRRIEQIGGRFTEILLAGRELRDILAALGDIAARPVAFADEAHQLIEYHLPDATDESEFLASWAAHSRLPHEGDPADCLSASVRLLDEEWGRLHMLSGPGGDEIDALALDRAAAAIALWLLSGRERRALAERARSDLITELWHGQRLGARDVVARSRTLGSDLDWPVLVGIAVELGDSGTPADETGSRASDITLSVVREQIERAGLAGIAGVVGGVCLGIVGLPADHLARPVTEQMGQATLRALSASLPGRVVSVGISRPGSAETMRRILTEAADGARHGAQALGVSGVNHSSDLGLRLLLGRLGEGPELSRFVEDELGPLLAHDSRGRTPLVPMLLAFLNAGGRKSDAARALHLERRSLYHRLDRIGGLLGCDLDDPSVRLRLQVALQALEVLRPRGARAP